MFGAWGRFVYRRRRWVAGIAVLVALATGVFAARISDVLSSGGWADTSSESAQVAGQLDSLFDAGRGSIVVLFQGAAGTDARSDAFQAGLSRSTAPLRADEHVTGIVGYAETRDDRFISTDGTGAYVLVELDVTDEAAVDLVDGLKAKLRPPAGVTLGVTGYSAISRDSNQLSEQDLQRAELVSMPLALLILIAVFASIVAAGMPLLVAGLAIPTALGLVSLLAERTEMSMYVLNVATMLGLALAIDYSLFMVSRFREELRRGRSVADAVERTVATSGKAVVFSAAAVAIGLSGLLAFDAAALTSMGAGGVIVVSCSAIYAVTFLPAVLGMLGPRVDALSVRPLLSRLGLVREALPDGTGPAQPGRWERLAHWVMARPVAVMVPVLLFLLVLGLPFLGIRQAIPDAAVLPPGTPSRDAYVRLMSDFPAGETSPVVVLATVPGDPLDPTNVAALARYAAALDAVPGVDRVESPFSGTDPATGQPYTTDQVVAAWSLPVRPPLLQAALDRSVRGQVVRFDAISPYPPARPAGTAVIPAVRALVAGHGITTQVGGAAAAGYDFLGGMSERLPVMLITVTVAMLIVLFLLFGSVVLPVKAVIMTLLSLTASFGALVWIFQDGNLQGMLGFTSPGYTVAGIPIIMFAVLLGLSMDYEVILLSRIQEAYRRTGDNTRAVGEGLARTAGVITGAALIMVVVFAAFSLADTITIKSIGVGMAIAVALDATVIRVLLVPATMRLLGDWNWWAPGPLARLADKVGFSHVEADDADVVPTAAPGGAPSGAPSRS